MTSLKEISGFPPEIIQQLIETNSVRTAEEFYSLAYQNFEALADHLKISIKTLKKLMELVATAIPPNELAEIQKPVHEKFMGGCEPS